MADYVKKTKASAKEHSNGQRGQKSKEPKQIGSHLASEGDVAKKKSDKKSSDKKHAPGFEAFDLFRKLQKSWPEDMPRLFDPSLAEDRRVELWQVMCEGGESWRRRFGWAIPDERALRIVEHFAPIVEIGSGLGYWAMLLRSRGVDFNAYDKVAGKPLDKGAAGAEASCGKRDRDGAKKDKKAEESGAKSKDAPGKQKPNNQGAGEADGEDEEPPAFWTEVKEGGPEKLEDQCNEERALFLCYPDEFEGDDDAADDDDDDDGLGLRCLHAFEGDVVIHVGELFGDSVCMSPGQSPWGRTTSRECQEELASRFHCVLKVPLPRWPHSRDTLTVWKRNEHAVVYYGSSDEDEEEDDDDNEEEDEEEKDKSGTSKLSSKDRKGEASRLSGEAPPAKKSKGGEDGDGVTKVGSKDKDKAKSEDIDKDDAKSPFASEGKGRKTKPLHGAKDDDGDDEDEEDGDAIQDGEALNASDVDSEMLESLMAGAAGAAVPDCDMYAFIPVDEQLRCEQAAPCMQFLLEEGRGKRVEGSE